MTGPQLRKVFGLFDTWAYFTSVSTAVKKPAATPGARRRAAPADGRRDAGRAARRPPAPARLTGEIAPAKRGAWITVQRRAGPPLGQGAPTRASPAAAATRSRSGPACTASSRARSTGPVVRVR